MNLTLTDELRKAARRCIWFEPPEVALKEPGRLAAYIFTYGSQEDVMALRGQIPQDDLQRLLDAVPPGIYDPRSWAYWHLMAGRYETPPIPQCKL